MASEYKYKEMNPFKEFRILTILGDTKEAPLRCRLKHFPLPSVCRKAKIDTPDYEAVSWHWGGVANFDKIVMEMDSESARYFPISENLADTLKGLRLADKSREMWIDALSINQKNTRERDLQVKVMFEIYNSAQNVCVWLGKHRDDSELALTFIKESVCNLGIHQRITKDPNKLKDWLSLASLMNRAWFNRRWVVQEIALAKRATVHCGYDNIDWSELETAVALFLRDGPEIAKHFRTHSFDFDPDIFGNVAAMGATRLVQAKSNLFRMDDKGEIVEYRFSLGDLVSNLSYFEAKEPHDLIYAILSLARDARTHVSTSEDDAEIEASLGAANHAAQPISASPPPVETDSTHGTRSSSQPSNSTTPVKRVPKRKSTTEVDLGRLSEKGRKALKTAVGKFQQTIHADNITKFNVKYDQPFFEVCKEFLRFTIPRTDTHNLDILCRPWAPKEQTDLPSWIPSVSNAAFGPRTAEMGPAGYQIKRKNADPLVGQTTFGRPNYNACITKVALDDDWRFGEESKGEDDRSLFVTGFILDRIGQVEDASQAGTVPADWLILGGWKAWNAKHEPDLESELPEELWRTLVADRGPDGGNTKEYYRTAFRYAVHHSTPTVGLETADVKQRGHPVLVEFLDRMEAVVWNRKLFRSERDNNLGLAPKRAKEGDCIVVLRGCSVPVILRRDRSGRHYSFIGECYLHTMMNGRAIEVQENLNLKTVVFELR